MAHLDPEKVAREFKGMVERCADCGFDLAGGLVEVVPTAHYMMGGVEFAADCSTALPGLFVAGEDSGGVHGANRLGGNGVANSTVFGAVAGDTMAGWLRGQGFRQPDRGALEAAIVACEQPFRKGTPCDLEALREKLYETMWQKVGIVRDAASLESALDDLRGIEAALASGALPDMQRAFNLTWHDWLNLSSLTQVSKVIATAALARRDSARRALPERLPGSRSAGAVCVQQLAWWCGDDETGRLHARPSGTISAQECSLTGPPKCIASSPPPACGWSAMYPTPATSG